MTSASGRAAADGVLGGREVRRVDEGASAALHERLDGVGADERDGGDSARIERKERVVVAEEDDRAGDGLAKQGAGLGRERQVRVDEERRLVADRADTLPQSEDAPHLVVDDALGDVASANRRDELLLPRPARPGHHEVEATDGRLDRRVRGKPVADHDAVEAPLAFENIVEEPAVLGGRRCLDSVVDLVVCGHDRPDPSVPHGVLERRQVHLAHGPLVDACDVGRAVGLGFVAREMLDAHPDAALLGGGDEARADPAGQVRVFGVALEVPAADGGALQVHDRGEHHIRPLALRLVGDEGTEATHEVEVPRGGDGGRAGELCRRGRIVVDAADSDGSVGDDQRAEAGFGEGVESPRGGAGEEPHLELEGDRRKIDRVGDPRGAETGTGGRLHVYTPEGGSSLIRVPAAHR